ncbi:translation initiation factor IF-2 [Catenulispora sp. GP43]|uniref:hypothetical protein n=1 Tax=Catenulispora sp. GP43 TaxID=3156263 RepID=UPI003515C2AC
MSSNALIGLGITAVITAVAAAVRSVVRERTIDQGKEAHATILHVQTEESSGPFPVLLPGTAREHDAGGDHRAAQPSREA